MCCYLYVYLFVGVCGGTENIFQKCVDCSVPPPFWLDLYHFLNRTFAVGMEAVLC